MHQHYYADESLATRPISALHASSTLQNKASVSTLRLVSSFKTIRSRKRTDT